MHRTLVRALGAGFSFSVASLAGAADLVIDSPQTAARGILAAVTLRDEIPADYLLLTFGVRDYADRVLRILRAGYTPAQLAALPAGVDLACPASGTFHARYAQRVLSLDLTACAFDIYGWTHTVTGPLQLKLKSDSFTPTTVAVFNAGSDTQDLLDESTQTGGSIVYNSSRRNLRLSGSVPLGRPTIDDNFEGSFSHAIAGFDEETVLDVYAWPGSPQGHRIMRITAADGSTAAGNYNYGDTSAKEDVTLNGTFSQYYWREAVPAVGVPEEEGQSVIGGATALRSLHTWNYNTGTENMLVSGAANYSWNPSRNLACANGGYNFATPTQWRHPDEMVGGTEGWNAGKLVVNNAATFTFTHNPYNSELGEMHVDVDIPGIGNFDYDGNSLWETDLPALAQCGP